MNTEEISNLPEGTKVMWTNPQDTNEYRTITVRNVDVVGSLVRVYTPTRDCIESYPEDFKVVV